ncbi:HAMP domain-containing histidine kinase [Solitalea sp. MAHUQ-68]|uniref:histidine kinase n=1 Tax=Solitalea agri TaxID=2953739 RepID=A0A9X2F374_9SPHI|nr:HAMP domain-containing histidine kinase [Solitalea agri]
MKLATKYNRITIAASIFIFLVGSVAFYFVLKYVLLKQLDDTLRAEQQEITQYTNEHKQLPEILPAYGQKIVYKNITDSLAFSGFRSVKQWSEEDKEFEWQRELTFQINVSGKQYEVIVSKSQVETEDLLELVILVTVSMIALILLAGYLMNRTILNRLWQPFYQSLLQVKTYNLSDHKTLNLPTTNIDEFSLLNQSLNSMSDRVQKDYSVLKEFTGNAAHEMQTPLAVIRSKLEMLMQNERSLEHNAEPLLEMEHFVNKLSRLNQSLLLLTKIEVKRFELDEEIQFDEILQQKINELTELISANQLIFKTEIEKLTISFNRQLAEIIIGNLLNNAVRYNYSGGDIDISLKEGSLVISNTSALPELDKEKVFQRFYRHPDTKSDGNGLGLSIVRQICEVANFRCTYQYKNDRHIFTIVLFDRFSSQ